MDAMIGKVQGLEGKFFARDTEGNVVELHNGDTISENMTVFGDKSNPSSAYINIVMIDTDQKIVIAGNSEQTFDSSLNNTEDVETAGAEDESILDEETAAGEEDGQTTDGVEGTFAQRDGDSTDIVADLRDADFNADEPVIEPTGIILEGPVATEPPATEPPATEPPETDNHTLTKASTDAETVTKASTDAETVTKVTTTEDLFTLYADKGDPTVSNTTAWQHIATSNSDGLGVRTENGQEPTDAMSNNESLMVRFDGNINTSSFKINTETGSTYQGQIDVYTSNTNNGKAATFDYDEINSLSSPITKNGITLSVDNSGTYKISGTYTTIVFDADANGNVADTSLTDTSADNYYRVEFTDVNNTGGTTKTTTTYTDTDGNPATAAEIAAYDALSATDGTEITTAATTTYTDTDGDPATVAEIAAYDALSTTDGTEITTEASVEYKLNGVVIDGETPVSLDGENDKVTVDFGDQENIDSLELANLVTGVEKLDFADNQDQNLNITLEDVISLTDESNKIEIIVDGDTADATSDDKVIVTDNSVTQNVNQSSDFDTFSGDTSIDLVVVEQIDPV